MLEDYPKEIVAKDGTPVLIRPLVKDDQTALLDFFLRIPENERWFLRDDLADPRIIKDWFEKLDYRRVLPLVAVREDDNTIIGNVRLHRRAAECLAHIAHLRIVVDPAFRNQRIGSWMLLDAVRLAMSTGIEKLVAEFVAGVEEAAMHAARKMDFFEQAVLTDYIKDLQGGYRDLIIMVKTVHRDWSDF